MTIEESKLRLSIDTKEGEKNAKNLHGVLEDVEKQGDETQDSLDDMGKSGKALGMVVKKLAVGFGGLMVLKKVNAEARESIELFYEQADAENILAASLGETSDALLENASAWQEQTRFGDEAIIRAQALVANFVKEEEQIKKLTPAILDLATAKKMSLSSAADLVTKSVASSTNAMSRYGIEIQGAAGSTERIDSAVQSLSEAFGGLAIADAMTGKGAIEQAENRIGDLREEVGKRLAPAFEQAKKVQVQLYESIIGNKIVLKSIDNISNALLDAGLAFEWIAGGGRKAELMATVSSLESYEKAVAGINSEMDELSVELSFNADGTIMAGSAYDRLNKKLEELNEYREQWLAQEKKIQTQTINHIKAKKEQADAVDKLSDAYEDLALESSIWLENMIKEGAELGKENIDRITGAYNALLHSVDEVAALEAERVRVLGVLDEALSNNIITTEQYNKTLQDWVTSNKDATKQAEESAKTTSEITQTTIGGALTLAESLNNTIADQLQDGEADWASWALSAVSNIGKVIAQIITLRAVQAGAALANANGNAFNSQGVQPVKAFAKGDVFNSPTAFSYGRGQMGVMGEAGPEAVMPLARGADGKLGVQVQGGASGVSISVSNPIHIEGNADSGTVQQLRAVQKSIIKQTEDSILKNIASGGRFAKATNRRA